MTHFIAIIHLQNFHVYLTHTCIESDYKNATLINAAKSFQK